MSNPEKSKTYGFRIPPMDKAPVLDGVLSPGEWARAFVFDSMSDIHGKLEERGATAYVGATETDFYVAVESELPPGGKEQLVAEVGKDSAKVVHDDSFEIWIDPEPQASDGRRFQFLFNSLGKGCYQIHTRGAGKDIPGWDGKIKLANGFTDKKWIVEARIPVESVAPGRKTDDGAWGISVCRNWKNPWVQCSAPGVFNGSDTRFTFGREQAVAVRQSWLGDPFTREIRHRLSLENLGCSPVDIAAKVRLERNSMPETDALREFHLEPGTHAEFLFEHDEKNSDSFVLSGSVVQKDSRLVVFDRDMAWGRPRKKRWDAMESGFAPVDFQFAHYPYTRKLRIRLFWTELGNDAVIQSAKIVVRMQWTEDVVAEIAFENLASIQSKEIERTVELPELDGTYEIALTASGKNLPAGELIKTFVRKRYPWERNSMGRSRKVYPPFTDIEVEGMTVKTVLREHMLNGLGLPEQIKAAGGNLLDGECTFRALIDGENVSAESGDFSFKSVSPAEAVCAGRFSVGSLSALSTGTWDYDGTLKYELVLGNSVRRKVEALDLIIPLKDSAAPMIHAMADGIRKGPISERLPDGEGVIWDSCRLITGEMPRGFCSYIFLGTPHRGLCWFAENDRGWNWKSGTPAVELQRRGGRLTVIVHLVNSPLVIDAPRKITFGLLAAPVKPRLPGWRDFWWTRKCTLLGTSINWLSGPGICGNVYPAGKDPYFWRMIARANTEEIPRKEIDECISRGMKYFEPFERQDTWVMHVNRNVGGARRGMTQIFYYNRAVTALEEEYATFLDEWRLDDFSGHDFQALPWEIKIVPSESYIDFALHWYAKSFEYGRNMGVYWDNWYIAPSCNTAMTDAYAKDGEIVPAAGIWGLRELCKRTFVMMNELGMLPITMPHMTSTNILPMHSFATVQYDWEWKYSAGDVQYRHSREYLQLVSNGELAGVIPVPLHDHGSEADSERVQRTFVGVTLLHELESDGSGQAWKTLRDPLIPVLRNSQLKVWRYWDEGKSPVKADNPDLPTIVYCIPGTETWVVVCSYSEKDEDAVIAIDHETLGLPGDIKAVNYETGETLPMSSGKLRLKVAKHEVIGMKISE